MRLNLFPSVQKGDYKASLKIAWMPTKLDDGSLAWLEKYISIQKKHYPKQDLPSHIQVPDEPFWTEIKRIAFPDVGIVVSDESVLKYYLEEFLKEKEQKSAS